MKKIILALCTLILVQNIYGDGSFIIGLESTKYNFKGKEPISISGFEGGVGYAEDSKLSLAFDWLYSFKPQKLKLNGYNKYYKLNSLYMDLYCKLKFKDYTSPYLIAGGTCSGVFPRKTNSLWKKIQGFENDPKFDYGLVFGGGVEIVLYSVAFRIEGRYRLGLANIELEGIKFKRNTMTVMLSVSFW